MKPFPPLSLVDLHVLYSPLVVSSTVRLQRRAFDVDVYADVSAFVSRVTRSSDSVIYVDYSVEGRPHSWQCRIDLRVSFESLFRALVGR